MPVRIATYASTCSACGIKISKGAKVAKSFDSGNWIHLRCQIRIIKSTNPEMTEGDAIAAVGRPPLKEAEFVSKIRTAAAMHGWLIYHPPPNVPTQSGYVREIGAGFPDLTLVHPKSGRLIFAELKSDGAKPTESQERWLAALRLTEALVDVWYPADLPRIHEILESYAVVPAFS